MIRAIVNFKFNVMSSTEIQQDQQPYKRIMGYTPGPWKNENHLVTHEEEGLIADCGVLGGCDYKAMEANAKLISEAPNMLDAILFALGGLPVGADIPGHAVADIDKIRSRLLKVIKDFY